MAEECGAFNFGDVVYAITDKLVRRHPHVFDNKKKLTPEEVKTIWHKIKDEERIKRKNDSRANGTLDGVALALPALSRAEKLQRKAAAVGFDWPSIEQVKAKISEELRELEETKSNKTGAIEEVGDLLFAVTNLARHLNVDPEAALRGANQKFERRFAAIEEALKERGKSPKKSNLQEMDALWNDVKADERKEKS
jgi:ATP diphosphatase